MYIWKFTPETMYVYVDLLFDFSITAELRSTLVSSILRVVSLKTSSPGTLESSNLLGTLTRLLLLFYSLITWVSSLTGFFSHPFFGLPLFFTSRLPSAFNNSVSFDWPISRRWKNSSRFWIISVQFEQENWGNGEFASSLSPRYLLDTSQ